MTPLIYICIGIAIGGIGGIFIGAVMCISKVTEKDYEYAVLHDKHIKLIDDHVQTVREYQDYVQGVEHE